MNETIHGNGRYPSTAWGWIGLLVLAGAVAFAEPSPREQVAPEVFRVGQIQQAALTESSGLTASRRYPGVYWTHNDGGTAFIFAINEMGDHLGAFEVQRAGLIDWEAIALDDAGNLYLGDTGTNGMARSHSAIHRVREPNPNDRWGPARVEKSWLIRFPGEREDCESIFVLNGYCYLIGKYPLNGRVSMYRFDLGLDSSSILIERVASIPLSSTVSDAALSADKARLALVTNDGVYVLFINGDPTSAGTAPRRFTEFKSTLMEGATFVPEGVLVSTEAIRDILLFTSPLLAGAPVFATTPIDQSSFVGRTVQFTATAVGFPEPIFQWRFNGKDLPGETGSVLTLTNLTLASSGIYEVSASNAGGSVRSSAQLTVTEKRVDVRITEVMSSELTVGMEDWWELTSFDSEPVDLSGWRFNDSVGGLGDAFVLPSGTVIQPGESVIFVEDLASDQFRQWWGEANFTPATQIITYSGSSLSFRATGDSLRLWDNVTVDENTPIARVDFGVTDFGVSFGYDPVLGLFGPKSQIGVNGAFRAATGSDIGSPGRIGLLTLESRIVEESVEISIRAEANGKRYLLESSDNLGDWTSEGEIVQNTKRSKDSTKRFYRVRTE